jgi:hydrogenase maturation protein HypF
MAVELRGDSERPRFDTVALSGGCFQNRVLFEETERRLLDEGFAVLSHGAVPANDGGLALGQAAIGAARLIAEMRRQAAKSPASDMLPTEASAPGHRRRTP